MPKRPLKRRRPVKPTLVRDISPELRARCIALYDSGLSREAVVEATNISISTANVILAGRKRNPGPADLERAARIEAMVRRADLGLPLTLSPDWRPPPDVQAQIDAAHERLRIAHRRKIPITEICEAGNAGGGTKQRYYSD